MASRAARVSVSTTVLVVGTVLALIAPMPAALAATTPSAPKSFAAKPGDQKVSLSWKAPASTGGAKIDAYRVTWWKSGTTTKHVVKLGPAARSYVQGSLRNGTKYVFQVAAHNRRGWGASAQASAVPRTTPGAPGNVAGTPQFDAIALTWSPAASNGAAIGKYGLRVSIDGGRGWTPATTSSGTDEVTTTATVVDAPRTSPTDNNVHPYLIQVRAHNAAGWGPWATARPAAGVTVQTPVFVPSNSDGDAAAAALRDRLTDSYWSGGYPTPAGAGTWHEGGPWVFQIDPVCSGSVTFACPGGTPQSPAPSFIFDFTLHAGDADRRAVTNVVGQHKYDLTYRARVTTSEPVAFSASGQDCTFTLDSTQGTIPDLTADVPLNFLNSGWQQAPIVESVSLLNLESSDFSVQGPGLCEFTSWSGFAGPLTSELATVITDRLTDKLSTDGCGTDEPFYWQPCYAVLDFPAPAPTAAPAVSRCPAGPPTAGPYLTLTCDGSTLVRTCADGWVDIDGQTADGCERSIDGLVPTQLDATTAQALADQLSGSFYLGGYPGGVGTGSWFAAPNPIRVPLRSCLDSSTFGCPNGVQQTPLPALTFDLPDNTDPTARQGSYNSGGSYTQLTLRGRASLTGVVRFRQDDVSCDLQIDTTRGAQPDIALNVVATQGNGPLTISPSDDSAGWVTVTGLEDQDIIVGPYRWCSYFTTGRMDEVRAWVRDTLVAWAQQHGELCGAPEPYYWQRCPS